MDAGWHESGRTEKEERGRGRHLNSGLVSEHPYVSLRLQPDPPSISTRPLTRLSLPFIERCRHKETDRQENTQEMASRTASKAFDYIQRGFSVALVVLSISGATAGYMIHSERMSIAGEYEKRLAEYNVALANEKASDNLASVSPTTNAPTPVAPSSST